MYSNIEFQHKRFRLLKGEIISKNALMKKLLLYIPFKKVPERSRKTIISYAIFIYSGKFHKLLLNSRTYSKFLFAWKRKF